MANIVIVDTKLVAYTAFHNRLPIMDVLRIFYDSLAMVKNPVIYWVFDEAGGSRRRKAMYPDYKGQREEQRKKQSVAEQRRHKAFIAQYEVLDQVLCELGTVVKIAGLEADDIGNLLCERLGKQEQHNVYLLSSDKDWASNMEYGNNIKQVHLKKGIITRDTCEKQLMLSPEHIIPFQALAGIEKENVKGVFRFGISKYQGLAEKFEDINDILDTVQLWVDEGKFGCRMPEGFDTVKEMYDFNYELLRKVELSDLTDFEKEQLQNQVNHRTEKTSVEKFEKTVLDTYEIFYYLQPDLKRYFNILE